jgi:ribulose-phosphate 3-epimerase
MSFLIAPSILAADFAALSESVATVEAGGADLIHVDVMDGHFVPNLTIGPPVVKALHRVAHIPLDVHLMITDPDRYIAAFAEAGAAMISVHDETVLHLHRTIAYIKEHGVQAGAVINPSTPVSSLEEIAGDLDFVVVMTVNPGFGGQQFITGSEAKIKRVRRLLDDVDNPAPIEVDGGVDCSNAALATAAGAAILVAGGAIFGTDDPAAATRALRAAAAPPLDGDVTPEN